jgi:transformation/transcription domain-associated protein
MHSAKCLTECPIAIVLIFQTYRSSMQAELQNFFPHAIENIQVVPELQRIALEEYNSKGELFVGISPKIQNRELFTEFYKAQTKTVAFLAYVLRNFASLFQNDYLATLPESCIRLLRSCGSDDVSTRKELLIATRHVLMSEQRAVFAPYIELLLNERVLLGTSVTAHEGLRALAISIVADLIHHVRNELTMSQLASVVHTFAVCLQDSTYPTNIQTMSGKLLNTACEAIAAKGEPQEAARLINVILTTTLERLEALTKAFDRLKAAHAKDEGKEVLTEEEDLKKNGWRDIERAMPIYAISYAHESIEAFCRGESLSVRDKMDNTDEDRGPLPVKDAASHHPQRLSVRSAD